MVCERNMKTVFITVGISASGKTTWANNMMLAYKDCGDESWCNINRDHIRLNIIHNNITWANYKFNKTNESKVSEIAIEQFNEAVELGINNIIISDTNLNAKYRDEWIKRAEDAGYAAKIVEFPITFAEACRRNELRHNGVSKKVIYQQYLLWNEYIGRKTYVPDTTKPKAILVDIDGTIAERFGRGPFEWLKVDQDKPRPFVIDLIRCYINYYVDYEIIFLSGRDSVCRHETLTWISRNMNIPIHNVNLHMRSEGDMRKDMIVKEEIFWNEISKNYCVDAVFDDRPQVVAMWHEIKIPNVIAVADQNLEF